MHRIEAVVFGGTLMGETHDVAAFVYSQPLDLHRLARVRGPSPSALERRGRVASLGELLNSGIELEHVRMGITYGKIRRIRRGWYASLDVPDMAIAALKVGGRLACVSALAHHGLCSAPQQLHVELDRTSSGPFPRIVRGARGR